MLKKIKQQKTGCWKWLGATNGRYGTMWYNGRHQYVHRVAVQLYNKSYNPALFVLHNCNNPLCINPEHLRQGTQKENIQQAVAEGRLTQAFKLGNKLAQKHQKLYPRVSMLLRQQKPSREIAKELGISKSQVNYLRKELGV